MSGDNDKNIFMMRNDLLFYELTRNRFEREKKLLLGMIGPKDVKAVSYDAGVGSTKKETDMELLGRIEKLQVKINIYTLLISKLKEDISAYQKQRTCIKKFLNETEFKIYTLHHEQKIPLKDIADSNNYSYEYIKKLNCILKKKLREGGQMNAQN